MPEWWSVSDDSEMSNEIVAEMLLNGVLSGVRFDASADDECPSVCLRCINKNQAFYDRNARFDRLYFFDVCVSDEKDFKRWFQMSRYVLDRVLEGIREKGVFLQCCVIDRSL